jgi:hypothetical protein
LDNRIESTCADVKSDLSGAVVQLERRVKELETNTGKHLSSGKDNLNQLKSLQSKLSKVDSHVDDLEAELHDVQCETRSLADASVATTVPPATNIETNVTVGNAPISQAKACLRNDVLKEAKHLTDLLQMRAHNMDEFPRIDEDPMKWFVTNVEIYFCDERLGLLQSLHASLDNATNGPGGGIQQEMDTEMETAKNARLDSSFINRMRTEFDEQFGGFKDADASFVEQFAHQIDETSSNAWSNQSHITGFDEVSSMERSRGDNESKKSTMPIDDVLRATSEWLKIRGGGARKQRFKMSGCFCMP